MAVNATTPVSAAYLAESRQGSLYAADTVTFVLAVLAIALRFWSRRLKKVALWIDDWLVLGALFVGLGLLVNFYWWIPRGYGRHIEYFGPDVDYYFFLGFFIAEVTYTFIIVLVKYSIIALYWRLFGRTNIKIYLWVLGVIVTCWGLATFFLTLFACVPTNYFWDKTVEGGACRVNSQEFLFGISIPNILTDVALLVLPIPYVLKLNTGMSQKQLLCGTFLLGGFVCIASILRLISVVNESTDPDFSWNWVDQGIWAAIETNFAMISACLPTLRPVWSKIFGHDSSNTKNGTNGNPVWSTRTDMASKRARTKQIQGSGEFDDPVALHPFTAIEDYEGFPAKSYAPSSASSFGIPKKVLGHGAKVEVSRIV